MNGKHFHLFGPMEIAALFPIFKLVPSFQYKTNIHQQYEINAPLYKMIGVNLMNAP
jgi:hypothetical protein